LANASYASYTVTGFQEYSIDEFDKENKAWAVDLHQGSQHLKTFIEVSEADSCVEGKSCIPLGMQIAQLKQNFDLTSCTNR